MGIGFRKFPQTPRDKGFSLRGFYSFFKCFSMFRLVRSLERPFDRSQNLGLNCWNFFENFFNGRDSPENYGLLVLTLCIKMYA